MSDIKNLTPNEERVLYGIVQFPEKNDKELAALLQMKDSTLTSIKKRLEQNNFFSYHFIPQLNRLGVELLGIIFTSFNPTIDFEERVKITKDKIESAQEIFYSVGAPEMGFSLSFTQNYSNFCAINEKRTETFGEKGLLEKEFPREVIFPFKISSIDEFFDYSRLFYYHFSHSLNGIKLQPSVTKPWFSPQPQTTLNEKEKKVFIALIENPKATMQEIGEKVDLSRHTVARMKKKFFSEDLIRIKIIPNLKKIGFKLLVFYHLKFSPTAKINKEIIQQLNSPSTLFCAHRKFTAVIISAYPEYSAYKEDKVRKLTFLKENNILNYTPSPRKYVFDQMQVIKDFTFYDITKKILGFPLD
ncbi:winged helix-turn-helix transcriptional regulator [Candidatus Harpocratesius sp.]